jgi:hypothetical protein
MYGPGTAQDGITQQTHGLGMGNEGGYAHLGVGDDGGGGAYSNDGGGTCPASNALSGEILHPYTLTPTH